MKLWDKGYTLDKMVEDFTVGNDRVVDLHLASYDVRASAAHATMLKSVGLLSEQELSDILKGLDMIRTQIEQGEFVIEQEFEDVHSKIEFELTRRIGDAGKKIHTARSRNDQVLVALHLYAKQEIREIKTLVRELFDVLISLARTHHDTPLPGYTHLQVAMPSSFGLWFGAYAETLVDDIILLNVAGKIADQNPLGSAAGYGTSFPIDREMTTQLLEFDTLKYNVVAAQMSRGRLEKTVCSGAASVASTIGKLAADICMYVSQNFGFIAFPKELTTGSSIMPHKQNPDVFELVRANCNALQSLPVQVNNITSNLTSGYHRDFQLLKEIMIKAVVTLKELLAICNSVLPKIIVYSDILEDPKYDFLYSVDEVNRRVMNGMSFRDAYAQIGQEIREGRFTADKTATHTHLGSAGNLALDQIVAKFHKHYEA